MVTRKMAAKPRGPSPRLSHDDTRTTSYLTSGSHCWGGPSSIHPGFFRYSPRGSYHFGPPGPSGSFDLSSAAGSAPTACSIAPLRLGTARLTNRRFFDASSLHRPLGRNVLQVFIAGLRCVASGWSEDVRGSVLAADRPLALPAILGHVQTARSRQCIDLQVARQVVLLLRLRQQRRRCRDTSHRVRRTRRMISARFGETVRFAFWPPEYRLTLTSLLPGMAITWMCCPAPSIAGNCKRCWAAEQHDLGLGVVGQVDQRRPFHVEHVQLVVALHRPTDDDRVLLVEDRQRPEGTVTRFSRRLLQQLLQFAARFGFLAAGKRRKCINAERRLFASRFGELARPSVCPM